MELHLIILHQGNPHHNGGTERINQTLDNYSKKKKEKKYYSVLLKCLLLCGMNLLNVHVYCTI